MLRFILHRLAILPFALILIHFLAFSYAYIAKPLRAASTPYLRQQVGSQPPLLEAYAQYIQGVFHGSLLKPLVQGPQIGSFAQELGQALLASVGLLAISLSLSISIGMLLGFMAVRSQPPVVRGWMSFISTIGLSMPSFYIGSLSILVIVFVLVLHGPNSESLIPIRGYGWDNRLILPVLALMLRPTVQIAQVTANMLVAELEKQYIVAARSFGHTWHDIRWRQALKNAISSIILSIAGTFRLLVGELIVVEWLFNWRGLGNLLAGTLVPNPLSTNLGANYLFLDPATLAGVITLFGMFFLVADMVASTIVHLVDPRLRMPDTAESGGGTW
jgi:peptide/nickel transport system permease protein